MAASVLAATVALAAGVSADPAEGDGAPAPVAAYSFDGGAARDSAGDHDGAVRGATFTADGKYGDGLVFDGVDDRVTVPDDEEFDFSDAFTVEAWVKPDQSKTWNPVLGKEDPGVWHSYYLYAEGNNDAPRGGVAGDVNSSHDVDAPALLPAGGWSHLALSSDGTDLKLYVDGNLEATASAETAGGTSGPLQIGALPIWNNYFEGAIDEVRLYDETLAASEVAADMVEPIQPAPRPEPVAAYSFSGGSARDGAGNHDGQIRGATPTSSGKHGDGLSFDGLDDWVTVADADALDLGSGFTLEAWVRPDELDGWSSILTKEDGTPNDSYGYVLYASDPSGVPRGEVSHGGQSYSVIQGSAALDLESWAHVALVSDGSRLSLWIDGTKVEDVAASVPRSSNGALRIGGNSIWGEFFDGVIDDVRIYSEPLGGGEIAEDMEAGAPEAPPPSPVAAYAFDGGAARDSAGSHDGAVRGATFTADGKYGDGLVFDGVDDRVTIPDAGDLDFSDAFTLEAWVKPEQSKTWNPVLGKEDPGVWHNYYLYAEGNNDAPEGSVMADGSASSDVEGNQLLPDDSWSYLAVSSDGTDLKLYVDGALEATASADVAGETSGPLQIGALPLWNNYFEGVIDEVRLYDETLAAGEVAADMEEPIQPAPRPEPVAAYAFSGGSAEDLSGDHDGTVVGASQAQGRYGDGLAFDGVDDLVVIPDDTELDLARGLTLEAWVRPDTLSGWDSLLTKEHSGAPNPYGYMLYANDPSGLTRGDLAHGDLTGTTVKNSEALPTETWSHIALVSDAEEVVLYVDGSAVGTAATKEVQLTDGDLYIGGNSIWGEFFDGVIDEVRLYDAPLTEHEVNADAARPIDPMPAMEVPPAVVGHAREGVELRANHGEWAGRQPMEYTFVWRRCDLEGTNCQTITGATNARYRVQDADVGNTLRVKVTATNSTGSADALSPRTSEVLRGAPMIDPDPVLQGGSRVGDTLSYTGGSVYGSNPLTEGLQWQRCHTTCQPVPGATGQTYELGHDDVGKWIRLKISAANDFGNARAVSPITPLIKPTGGSTLAPNSVPGVQGEPRAGAELELIPPDWQGTPSNVAVQWQRCETASPPCVDIPGATSTSYEVASADVNEYLRVVTTATEGSNHAEVASGFTPSVLPAELTAVVFDDVSLQDIIQEPAMDVFTLAELTYEGEHRGSYHVGDAEKSPAIAADEIAGDLEESPGDVNVVNMVLRNDGVAAADLESLQDDVLQTGPISTDRRTIASPQASPVSSLSSPEEIAPIEIVNGAGLWAWGWDDATPRWPFDTSPLADQAERTIYYDFAWGLSAEELADHSAATGFEWALEINVKLHNDNNDDLGGKGIACWPWERNNFWVGHRDAQALMTEGATEVPEEAGLYWDTDFSDSCKEKDLSIGVLRPEALNDNTGYRVRAYLFAATGDGDESPVTWDVQLLERNASNPICSVLGTSWCAGLREREAYTLPLTENPLMLDVGGDYVLPGCFDYDLLRAPMTSFACVHAK